MNPVASERDSGRKANGFISYLRLACVSGAQPSIKTGVLAFLEHKFVS